MTRIKDKVIAETLTQKGFCKGSTPSRCNDDFFFDPILKKKKELPSINHLPNGNDRIILPGGQHSPHLPQKGSRKEMETQHP